MTSAERYPFRVRDATFGGSSLQPLLPLRLSHDRLVVETLGLVDSGSSLSVIPWEIGLRLGLDWDSLDSSLQLVGSLAGLEAKAISLEGTIGTFPPVRLGFAWSRAENIPTILGQINFFLEFDVCFFRTRNFFEVKPRLMESEDALT